jgi:hypothetical protein
MATDIGFRGRKMTQAEKDLRKLSIGRFKEMLGTYLNKPVTELQEIIKRKHTPAIDVAVISILLKAIREADPVRMNFFFDRLYGKPKANFEGLIGVGTIEEVTGGKGMPTVADIEASIAADPFVTKAIEIRKEDYKKGIEPEPEAVELKPKDLGITIESDPFA